MTNTIMLKQIIDDSGMTKTFIAQKLGCGRPRLYNILDGAECTVSEMIKLSDILHLTKKQREEIFFAHEVV